MITNHKPYLEDKIFLAKCLKCTEPNISNQIFSIIPTKQNPPEQFYKPNLEKPKQQ